MFEQNKTYISQKCPYSDLDCLFVSVSKYPCNICDVLKKFCKEHHITKNCDNCGNIACEKTKLCDEWYLKEGKP